MGEQDTGDQGNTEGAGEQVSFVESLGDHSSNELFTGVESAADLAAKHVELSQQHAELAAAQVQKPENEDGYTFELPEGLTEADTQSYVEFKKVALEMGLSNEQYQKTLEYETSVVQATVAKFDEAREAAKTELVAEFGDKYDAKLDEVKAVLKKFGGEKMLADINVADPEAGLMNHPDFFRFLDKVASAFSSDTLADGGAASGNSGEKESWADRLYPKKA